MTFVRENFIMRSAKSTVRPDCEYAAIVRAPKARPGRLSCFGSAPSGAGTFRKDTSMRIWAKEFRDNRMLRDMVVVNEDSQMTRTKKVFAALEEV